MMGFAKNYLPANSSRRVAVCLDNPRHGYSPSVMVCTNTTRLLSASVCSSPACTAVRSCTLVIWPPVQRHRAHPAAGFQSTPQLSTDRAPQPAILAGSRIPQSQERRKGAKAGRTAWHHRPVPHASEHRLGQLLDRDTPNLFAIKGFDAQSTDSLSHQLPVLSRQ